MQRDARHRLLLLKRAAVLLAIAAVTVGASERVPWPYGVAPTADTVHDLIEEALRIGRRERFEEYDGTQAVVEERGAVALPQSLLDRGEYDLDAVFIQGDEVFAHFFGPVDGYGGLLQGPQLQRVHRGVTGGLDGHDCDGCHSVGGLDGAGTFAQDAFLLGDGDTEASAARRNPPSLLGAGLVQALAAQMTAELAAQRARGVEEARRTGRAVTVELVAKGVRFGRLGVAPDGTFDTSGVEGIGPDLVVRPFGWKGDVARLRRFVEEAARVHFGAQSYPLEARNRDAPDEARVGQAAWDPDGDGVTRELDEGSLTATAAYLAMLETPVVAPPADPALLQRWGRGDQRLDPLGCTGCHVRTLKLLDRTWEERADTTAGAPLKINLLLDGEQPRGVDQVNLFSDLKRHDMGPGLADAVDHPDGISRSHFLTRSLWGLAETPPYLHTGAAHTIAEAILAHGGEAQAARDAFAALPPDEQADVIVFLSSLTRQPKLRVAR